MSLINVQLNILYIVLKTFKNNEFNLITANVGRKEIVEHIGLAGVKRD